MNRADSKQYDYVLFEKGFIQYLTALSDDLKITQEYFEVIKILLKEVYYRKYVVFYCTLSIDENIQRLKTRNRVNDKFVLDDISEMKNRLYSKIVNIEMCTEGFPKENVVCIDMDDENLALENVLKNI